VSDKPFLNQSTWRRAGAATIALAALMAVYAVVGGVLRDSVIHLARLFSDRVPAETIPEISILFCSLYWIFVVLLLLASLYMAILDIRFIRLHFTLGKQALMKESLGSAAPMGHPRQEETATSGDTAPESNQAAAPEDDRGEA